MDWTQPQEARQVWISFLNLSVQEEQFKVTIWKCTHTSLKSIFLVFYLYLPIEVAQRGKMAKGGHSPLAGVAWVWFCRPGITCTCGLSLLLVHVLALRVFLCASVPLVFLLPQNQHSKFQFNQQAVEKKSHLVECPLLSSHLFIYLFYLIEIKKMGIKT